MSSVTVSSAPPRSRVGLWALARVEASAFAGRPEALVRWPVAGRTCLRVVMWLTLVVCDRRVNEAGTALCMLNPSPGRAVWRVVRVTAPVSVLLLWLAFAEASLFWLAMLALLAFWGPCAWSSWRSRRARRILKSFGPAGEVVFVHSVASVERGAGAVVMRGLVAEADRKGWRLALDAGNLPLAEYYTVFGFVALGQPVRARA
jgi:hypothetical protein